MLLKSSIVKPKSKVPKSQVPRSRSKGLGLTLKSYGPPSTQPTLVYLRESHISWKVEANTSWDILPACCLVIRTPVCVDTIEVGTVSLGQSPGNTIVSDHVGVVFVVKYWCLPTDPGSIVSRVKNVCLAQSVSSHESSHLQRVQTKLC